MPVFAISPHQLLSDNYPCSLPHRVTCSSSTSSFDNILFQLLLDTPRNINYIGCVDFPLFSLLLLYVYLITLSACCTRTQTDGQPAGQTLQCCVIYGNWTCNGIGNIKKLIPIDFHEKILICRLNYNAQSHHQPITTYGGCPGTHADPPIRLEGVHMAVRPSAS